MPQDSPCSSVILCAVDSASKIKSIVTSVAPPFALIQQVILQCVTLLDQLDELILLCAPNATLTPTSNTIDGIVATQLIAENTNTGNTYKGFILEIETRAYTPKVDQSRAVGKNNQGIISITTDYSFASNPNVLIDELKFMFIIDGDTAKREFDMEKYYEGITFHFPVPNIHKSPTYYNFWMEYK